MTKPNVLYITYDGLLDPLGGSQILPYLRGIAAGGGRLTVLSFEKRDRFDADGAALRGLLSGQGIVWRPLRFTRRGGALAKLWDISRMYVAALAIALGSRVKGVHARGHPPAMAAHLLKRLLGTLTIFDFRGFWVDERVDKGGWDLSRALHRWQYRRFKRIERRMLGSSDALVVLSEAAVPKLRGMGLNPSASVTVIPCCADFDHFPLATAELREQMRAELGIPSDATVIGYLGSIGQMYLPERFFQGFVRAAERLPALRALIISPDTGKAEALVLGQVPAGLRARVLVRSASRDLVPRFIAVFDMLASLIQPSEARVGASPTKVAECLASGVPVICNAGVGDVAGQVRALDAGVIVDPWSDDEFVAAVERIDAMGGHWGARLREASRKVFGLEIAHQRYLAIYSRLGLLPC
jgi:glycosyltransferase involved in cell wall biosynthesis